MGFKQEQNDPNNDFCSQKSIVLNEWVGGKMDVKVFLRITCRYQKFLKGNVQGPGFSGSLKVYSFIWPHHHYLVIF